MSSQNRGGANTLASNTLADAQAAQQAKRAAVEALREICLDDEQMISDVYRRYGR